MRAEHIAAVIWCTGFGPDTGWLRVPLLMPDGSPAHTRGITAFPGLYVAGYPWLSTRGSGLLYGVAADSARIAQHIAGAPVSEPEGRDAALRPRPGTRPRHNQNPHERRRTMTREPAEPLRLDYLIKARAVHSMTGETYQSVGLRGPVIVAVSDEPDGLDDLAGPDTVMADMRDLTLLPAFADAHEHLMEASRNTLLVPVDRARSVADFTGLVGAAARDAAPGKWIVTSMGWHESNLAENRMPTGAELDAAAPGHPVFARRGGHLAVASSLALEAAGIEAGTPDPPGGKIGRLADGRPSGCWRAARSTRSARTRPRPPGPSWPALSGRDPPRTRRSGWPPSGRR